MSYVPLLHTKVSLSPSDISNLNSTPVQLIESPGSGKAIEVISAVGQVSFDSSAYTTNTELKIEAAGAASHQLYNTDLLTATSNKIEKFDINEGGTLLEDTDIDITVASGDPQSGNSFLDIFLSYRIIYDLS